MGRKGVSKRKPKQSRPFSSSDIRGSTNGQTPVQTLMKDKGAHQVNRGPVNSTGSSNKKQQKGN